MNQVIRGWPGITDFVIFFIISKDLVFSQNHLAIKTIILIAHVTNLYCTNNKLIKKVLNKFQNSLLLKEKS
jgi:hypothetical protein